MDREWLAFLLRAKRATYAGKGPEEPVWAMNYAGWVTGGPFSGDFLKEALKRGTPEAPYRGPESYTEGPYTYRCSVSGAPEWFQGRETISRQGRMIYECFFHGGLLR